MLARLLCVVLAFAHTRAQVHLDVDWSEFLGRADPVFQVSQCRRRMIAVGRPYCAANFLVPEVRGAAPPLTPARLSATASWA